MLETPFFRMLTEGNFLSVKPVLVNGHMCRSPESEAYIQKVKEGRLAKGIKAWPNDAKPSRFHYVGAEGVGNTLLVKVEPCVSYDDHAAGTSQEFLRIFGWDYLPNALATTVLLESEGHMLVANRLKVDYKKGGFHFSIGGFIGVKEEPDGDPVHAVVRELEEEAGVRKDEIELLTCLGIAWDIWQNKPDVIFTAKTSTPIAELRQRKTDKENSNFWMPVSERNVARLLLGSAHSVVPMGMAALLFSGKRWFGEDWFSKRIAELEIAGKGYEDPSIREQLEKRDIEAAPLLIKELCF